MVLILSLFRRASNPQLQHQQLHRDHFLNGDRDGVLDRFPFPDEDVRDLLVHGDGDGSVGDLLVHGDGDGSVGDLLFR